jgi:TRIAD3 protein (E3 ubiquitin-protein ligase RNF216)
LEQVKQQKEIEEADLEGLEECPFCDYKCVIEADKTQEKLFRCGNIDGGCGAVSCRECKRPV